MRYIATCKMGLESTVSWQLVKLGMQDIKTEDARVFFSGDRIDMCRGALWLRTAERLLLEIKTFHAETFEELYQGIFSIPWNEYLGIETKIHVNGKSAKSKLFSVSDCQSIAKKAVIEKMKASYHVSYFPESAEEVIIEIGILKDEVTVALDCCGAGLSRRGYRTYNVTAPLSETLGAAMILLSRYHADQTLIDPMCGSGTMPIEAAMIAKNMAPGMGRAFSSEHWRFVPHKCWDIAREEAKDSVKNISVDILGSDIDPRCIDLCKKHAKKAGIMVNWAVRDISETISDSEYGIFVVNPPYGERLLEHDSAADLYKKMRLVFERFPGWTKNIISGYRYFESVYGQQADKRRKLSNGGMACTLYQYRALKWPEKK